MYAVLAIGNTDTESKRKPPRCCNTGTAQGGEYMYTDYGYVVDGVEYATIDEAMEALADR